MRSGTMIRVVGPGGSIGLSLRPQCPRRPPAQAVRGSKSNSRRRTMGMIASMAPSPAGDATGAVQQLPASRARDRITEAVSLGLPRSSHSAQAEMLDLQEAAGSPASPSTLLATLDLIASCPKGASAVSQHSAR